jgi:RNA 2',3'-cyclic 3'-phosphodiesterase
VPIPGWEPRPGATPTHLTLRFLGEVDPARLPALEERLGAVALRHGPFAVRLAGVDAFPDRDRPRIVYLGIVAGQAELIALAADVEGELAALGFPRERRPFRPHVTLGRIRSPRDAERFHSARAALGDRTLLSTFVDALLLKASALRPSGAQHSTLASFPLRAAIDPLPDPPLPREGRPGSSRPGG